MLLLLPTVFCWVGIHKGLGWTVLARALEWGHSQLVAGVGMAGSGASRGWPSLSLNPRVSELLLVLCPHGWFVLQHSGFRADRLLPSGWLPSEGTSQESGADRHGPDLIWRLRFQQHCFDHWTQSCLRSLNQFEFIFVYGVS